MSDCFDHEGDAIDDLCFGRSSEGEPDDFQRRRAPYRNYRTNQDVSCKYCGAGGFRWSNVGGGWALIGNGGKHTCRQYREAHDAAR